MNEPKQHFSFKETMFKGLTELMVLIFAITFFFIIYKVDTIFSFVKLVCSILMPIILGLTVAYLVNPMVVFFEGHINQIIDKKFHKKDKKNRGRMPAILISFCILFIIIYILGSLVVPQIYQNVRNLIYSLPSQINQFVNWLSGQMENDQELRKLINSSYEEAMTFLTNWVKTDMFGQVTVLVSGVVGVVGGLVDFLIGVIVAIYVLMSKETFGRQLKKVLHAFLDDRKVNSILNLIKDSDRIFGGFISGKLVDSLIIGLICFIGAVILQLPYAVLVSVIVGVTNIIPFFGPYIGAVPSSILILLASPSKGVIFIVFVIVLQQFDGNILGPKILGESTGLSPFWVIFSILLGGGLFGIIGMLIGVPTFGVIYHLFKSFVNYRLEKKKALLSQ